MRTRLRAFASVGVVVAALAAAPARADLLARRVVLEEQAGAAEIATAADGYGGVYQAFVSADRTKVLVTVSRDDGLDYGPNVPVGSPPGPGRTLRNVRICDAGDAGMADRTDVYVVWEKTGEPGQAQLCRPERPSVR